MLTDPRTIRTLATFTLKAEITEGDLFGLEAPEHEGELCWDGQRAVLVAADGSEIEPAAVERLTPADMHYTPCVATHWLHDGDYGAPSAHTIFIRARDLAHAEALVAEHQFAGIASVPAAGYRELFIAAHRRGYPLAVARFDCFVVELRAEIERWLKSGPEVAAELGIDESRVRQLAAHRGVGRIVGATRVFTPSDIDALRVRKVGRPRKAQP